MIPEAVSRTRSARSTRRSRSALGVRQVQQHLVVVQRQAVLALELGRELAGDRGVCAQERNPAVELERWLDRRRRHSCALKCSASQRPFGPPDRVSDMGHAARARGIEAEGLVRRFKDVEAVAGIDLTVAPGRDLRLPRPERRRQVHDRPHADDAAAAHGRPRDGRRLRRGQAGAAGARLDRRRAPGGGARPVPDRPRAPAAPVVAARDQGRHARRS